MWNREIEKRCRAAIIIIFLSFFTVTNYHNPQKPADFSFPARFNFSPTCASKFFRLRIRIIGCCFSIQLIVQRSNHSPCRTKVHHLASQVTLPLHLLTIPHHSNQGVVLALEAEHLRVR